MRDPRIAEIVANALAHFDEKRYLLYAWVVMPNHAHLVLSLAAGERIDRVMQSIKGFSSHTVNRLLGRAGSLWLSDYFDRSIRGAEQLARCIRYVERNPLKAGMCDWPWVRSHWSRVESPGGTPGDCGRDVRAPRSS